MKKLIDKIYNYNESELKKINKIVDKIEALDIEISALSNKQLKGKTDEFKKRIKNGESLNDILPEAFAVVREASYRVLGMKHYRVQLIGGVVLHQGRVAEMNTGEGKTLVATCPAYLNALTEQGVHIITSNEYLAKRDCEEMGELYEFLGISSGVILHENTLDERREIYKKDIVYAINSEIGFDYLKDNMVKSKNERVQRGFNYVIIDEIDSILIDEARTPLIISGDAKDTTEYYVEIDEFVKSLIKNQHYEIDEKKKVVTLSEAGIDKLEEHFDIDNYADEENIKLRHHITQSLKANYAMTKDIDYIESDCGEILIVDILTGRVMEGRRFSDGLHQALEAKEDVDIQPESETLATITLQNLFRSYNKLSGMSGTVATEEEEFRETYGIDVVVIPTNNPVQRIDRKDIVYIDIASKYYAIIDEIIKTHKKGQPVLVGTASIQKLDDISALLKRRKIPHQILNAKNHAQEAEIVSRAGEIGAITIATNMAGRGTDIKLSEEVKALGGLKVIGTERHDSIRVDNQLRGRAGRQGDPGESVFIVSIEDDMTKNYISEKYKKIISRLVDAKGLIDSSSAQVAVDSAQRAIEGDNFQGRKDVLGYDDALNKQREVIYNQRNSVLETEEIDELIIPIINSIIDSLVKSIEYNELDRQYIKDLNVFDFIELEVFDNNIEFMKEIVINKYYDFSALEGNKQKIREILLSNVDKLWIQYLKDIQVVRQGIVLQSYKQIDPVQVFMIKSSEIFNDMTYSIKKETVKDIFEMIYEQCKG